MNWDFSSSLGANNFHFYGDETFNASLGAAQTHFDDGGFNFAQNTINANFSKELGKSINVAFGAEYRFEQYRLFAGEEGSYKNYDPTGDKATGAQGFPGYQPNDEVNLPISYWGIYRCGMGCTQDFLVGGAVRVENYSDFGLHINAKLSTRVNWLIISTCADPLVLVSVHHLCNKLISVPPSQPYREELLRK